MGVVGTVENQAFLLVSSTSHPFHGEEYLVAVVTTTERNRAIPLDGGYTEGGLPEQSFVSPWSLVTLKDDRISKRVASVAERVLVAVADTIADYLGPESEPAAGGSTA